LFGSGVERSEDVGADSAAKENDGRNNRAGREGEGGGVIGGGGRKKRRGREAYYH
jgi:hypothetical protein